VLHPHTLDVKVTRAEHFSPAPQKADYPCASHAAPDAALASSRLTARPPVGPCVRIGRSKNSRLAGDSG